MKSSTGVLFTVAVAVWLGPSSALAQTVTFDFDSGTPALSRGQSTPFDQTAGGLTARFSSPSDPAFSIQSDSSTGWKMSQFSGNYIYDNSLNKNTLSIKFSQAITGITLTFATADFQQNEVPTTIQLTAYVDSNTTPPVGSVTAHGTYASDTMPMGKVSFSAAKPFNLVEITIPPQALGAADFFVDNVAVTFGNVLESVSGASYVRGAPVGAGAIASGFGQGLAATSEAAGSVPLPMVLANTTVKVKDAAGTERQAPLYYVGPTQINYVIPDGTATGPAVVTVTSVGQVTATGTVSIDVAAPGIFTANADGQGAPAAWAIVVAPDLTQSFQLTAKCGATAGSCVTAPIDMGASGNQLVLSLYGTGVRGASSLAGVVVKVAGMVCQVQYAGAQSQYPGLDQINAVIPRAMAGMGEVDVVLTVDSKPANTVRVNFK